MNGLRRDRSRATGVVVTAVVTVAAAAVGFWMAAPSVLRLGSSVSPPAGWPGRPWVAAAAVIVAAVVAVVAGSRSARSSADRVDGIRSGPDRSAAPVPIPAGPAAPAVGQPGDGPNPLTPDTTAERTGDEPGIDALIESVIGVRDLVRSDALAGRLGAGLTAVGVETDRPVGAPFDPARHHAVESVPTDDPRLVGTIAAVERVGYHRSGLELRPAEVVVYRDAP